MDTKVAEPETRNSEREELVAAEKEGPDCRGQQVHPQSWTRALEIARADCLKMAVKAHRSATL